MAMIDDAKRFRRYDLVHDANSVHGWHMKRRAEGQYVPWVDVEKFLKHAESELEKLLKKAHEL